MSNESFWKEEFGDEYHERQKNKAKGNVQANMAFFSKILSKTIDVTRIIEFGAGTGQNIDAITRLNDKISTIAVEVNEEAAQQIPNGFVFRQSIFDFRPPIENQADLVFTKGLLIHLNPEDLRKAYNIIYRSTRRYILIAEYYNPTSVEVNYRGHDGKLWKRDFAGDMLDLYPGLELIDYGFVYHKDQFPQDDLTWFLMEKRF